MNWYLLRLIKFRTNILFIKTLNFIINKNLVIELYFLSNGQLITLISVE